MTRNLTRDLFAVANLLVLYFGVRRYCLTYSHQIYYDNLSLWTGTISTGSTAPSHHPMHSRRRDHHRVAYGGYAVNVIGDMCSNECRSCFNAALTIHNCPKLSSLYLFCYIVTRNVTSKNNYSQERLGRLAKSVWNGGGSICCYCG